MEHIKTLLVFQIQYDQHTKRQADAEPGNIDKTEQRMPF
jgi:hypothetical protein